MVLSVVLVSSLVAVVVLSLEVAALSSLLAQEMTVRLKRDMANMMSICLNWFPISGLGLPNIYQNLGDLSINGDFTWRLSDSVEN